MDLRIVFFLSHDSAECLLSGVKIWFSTKRLVLRAELGAPPHAERILRQGGEARGGQAVL